MNYVLVYFSYHMIFSKHTLKECLLFIFGSVSLRDVVNLSIKFSLSWLFSSPPQITFSFCDHCVEITHSEIVLSLQNGSVSLMKSPYCPEAFLV